MSDKAKAVAGVDQEGSTARTDTRASCRICGAPRADDGRCSTISQPETPASGPRFTQVDAKLLRELVLDGEFGPENMESMFHDLNKGYAFLEDLATRIEAAVASQRSRE